MDAKQLQWPGEPPRPHNRPTVWLNVGATRDAIRGVPKPFWAFDPEGVLVPLPCTIGCAAPQLAVSYVIENKVVLAIKSVTLSSTAKERGWREADALFAAEGREDKVRAWEAFKAQFDRGVNQALPDAYLPEVVAKRRVQVKEEANRLELPPLDDEPVEAKAEAPKKTAKQKAEKTEG